MQGLISPREKSSSRLLAEARLAQAIKQADVEHILDAVGREFVRKRINRRRLRRDINEAAVDASVYAWLDSSRQRREFADHFEEIERTARHLRKLLSGSNAGKLARLNFRFSFPTREGNLRRKRVDRAASMEGLVIGLARLARVARQERNRIPIDAPMPRERNAREWLIVEYLPRIFERYFGREAKIGRAHNYIEGTTGKANSPYIRFASAVLNDIGIVTTRGKPYSPETISREFQRVRSGARPRRKSVSMANARTRCEGELPPSCGTAEEH